MSKIAATGILLLAACSTDTARLETASPEVAETAMPSPTAAATAERTATATPTPQALLTPEATPASAFAETDQCTNDEHGWTVVFPESWWTNISFSHPDGNEVSACWMFSPNQFDATAAEHANQTPPGVDVWLRWVPPPAIVGTSGEVVDEQSVTVSGYDGTRLVWRGTAADQTAMDPDDEMVQYIVSLPEDVDFMAFADSRFSNDFDHAVEVLDGMMERIELSAP